MRIGGEGPAPARAAPGAGSTRSRRAFLRQASGTLAAATVAGPALVTRTTAGPRLVSAPAAAAGAPGTAAGLFRQLDEKILAGMHRYQVPGAAVAVLYRGHEHVRGFGITDVRQPVPVDGDTLFRIGSTSKTFTGTAAMRLVDAGRLELDREVRHYLPSFQAPPGAQTVTVRQLLNHSAGWLGDDFSDTGRGAGALPRYVTGMRALPQLTPVGTVFAYNNAALTLAGRVVEAAAGQVYEYAVRELLLAPLGLRHSFFFSDEIIGYNIAASHATLAGRPTVLPAIWHVPRSINPAGGLIASASDLLRWARFHLGDGRAPDGRRLLTAASLAEMRSHPGPGGTLVVELTGMGVSWMLRPTAQGVRVVQHGGHWAGQISGFLMVPGQQFALALLTNSESAGPLVNEFFAGDWALRAFTGLTNLPARDRWLSQAELARYEGHYTAQTMDSAGRLTTQRETVTVHDSGLRLATGQAPATLLTFYDSPSGPDYVLVRDADGSPRGTRANFIRDRAGQVRWLRLGGRLHRRHF
jgi:CubicO group peptidase (beta-lactamase class C family)